MAFMKYANAVVSEASVQGDEWQAVKQKGTSTVFNTKTASSIINEYPPSEYLLTHSTIIASVDVEDAPNAKTGHIKEGGRTINRKWSDYYIKPETSKYINGNSDSWDRQTLLNTYKTFVGAENYVEHIQVPELSKGKVIDAAARDLGDTVYIDILVATSRKHEDLINDIQSGKINTLSMGCSIDYSRCSKCGNVAADETELCEHIKYSKGNFFHDKKGVKRVIAEICGHSSDPDSVTFIEASWVANPAFKGAVLRDVLNGDGDLSKEERQAEISRQKQLMDASPMLREFMENQNIDKFLRQANDLTEEVETIKSMKHDLQSVLASVQDRKMKPSEKVHFDQPDKESFGPGPDDDEDDGDDTPPLEDVKEDLKNKLRDEVTKDLLQELQEDMDLALTEPMFEGPADAPQLNENIIEAYQTFAGRYASELKTSQKLRNVFSVVYAAKVNGWDKVSDIDGVSNKEIVTAMYLRDRDDPNSKPMPQSLYSCLLKIGSQKDYRTLKGFLNACELALGRKPTTQEAKVLIQRSGFLQ